MKKTFLAAAISSALLLAASQCMAAAYAPGNPVDNGVTPTSIQQTMPQSSPMGTYISPSGYQTMSAQPGAMMMAYSNSRQRAWWGLLVIFTVALVWANLLLLIAFLWKHVKKHK
jgi:hypothetical protein